jgi:hypothetical protein
VGVSNDAGKAEHKIVHPLPSFSIPTSACPFVFPIRERRVLHFSKTARIGGTKEEG